jgi:hypothetical protein
LDSASRRYANGILEYWNSGMMGSMVFLIFEFFIFLPNIPSFQPSIIPGACHKNSPVRGWLVSVSYKNYRGVASWAG